MIFAAVILRMLPRPSSDVNLRSGVPLHVQHAMIFVDSGAVAVGGAGEAADEFSRIERAAGNFVHDSECSGIIPANR